MNKIKWVKNKAVADQHDGYINGVRLYILQRTPFTSNLWTAEKVYGPIIVDRNGSDAHYFHEAKKLCQAIQDGSETEETIRVFA